MERHLHPSIYEKMELTEALLEQNTDKKDLESKGGLDFDTYEALQRRGEIHQQNLMEYKQEIKSYYGSLSKSGVMGLSL